MLIPLQQCMFKLVLGNNVLLGYGACMPSNPACCSILLAMVHDRLCPQSSILKQRSRIFHCLWDSLVSPDKADTPTRLKSPMPLSQIMAQKNSAYTLTQDWFTLKSDGYRAWMYVMVMQNCSHFSLDPWLCVVLWCAVCAIACAHALAPYAAAHTSSTHNYLNCVCMCVLLFSYLSLELLEPSSWWLPRDVDAKRWR